MDKGSEVSDAVKISISAKSALNTDSKMEGRKSATPGSLTTITTPTQSSPSSATFEATVPQESNATSEFITIKPHLETRKSPETKTNPKTKYSSVLHLHYSQKTLVEVTHAF
ncbi:hypothetical protein E2C01_014431 [Portunus trituberculatus]|uniref:Uncharacterized protein n=1 Tax=Portunus trituberculatus TaxID=210409 RepID=A0A5B7DKG1_PORTR|nr:hypothetical protein [Portunus trituberculatus]